MTPSSIARRYAQALFDLAVEAGPYEKVGEELKALAGLADHPEFGLLFNPVLSHELKKRILVDIGQSLKLNPLTLNTLLLLADRNRLHHLPTVAKVYASLADKKAGRVRARVTSAITLSEDTVGQITNSLSRATNKQVVVDRNVDPSILGGVVAQVGSLVYDGSLRTQLHELGRQLKNQR